MARFFDITLSFCIGGLFVGILWLKSINDKVGDDEQ